MIYLCVNVAVREKIDVGIFHFGDCVFVNNLLWGQLSYSFFTKKRDWIKKEFDVNAVDLDHFDNVIKGQEAVTFDLGVHVLPHGAARQKSDLKAKNSVFLKG